MAPKKKRNKQKLAPKPKKTAGPVHPWRICPAGEHWVITHPLNMPTGPTTRSGHCRTNPSHKDTIYKLELDEIAGVRFKNLTGGPNANNLGYKNGSQYDSLIRGWTQYWNEVFKPQEPLDPDLVKALIATESTFNPTAKPPKGNSNSARGLMQITNKTRKILSDEKGELKDHIVNVDREDIEDPNLNIAAGVRWLFRKREIAQSKNKTATWRDAVAEYKSYKNPNHPQMLKFDVLYGKLKK